MTDEVKTYAQCEYCGQEMKPGVACTYQYFKSIDGKLVKRSTESFTGQPICHDCNAPEGGYHHPGCDCERCPICGGQVISCSCGDDYPYVVKVEKK